MAEQEMPSIRSAHFGRGEVALIVLAVIASMAAFTYLGAIFRPFLTAVFLYFATRSAANALIRFGCPAWLAWLVLFVLAAVIATLLTLLAISEMATFQDRWPKHEQQILDLVAAWTHRRFESVDQMFKLSAAQIIRFVFEQSLGLSEYVLMTFFYLLFIILDAHRASGRVMRAFPGERGARILEIAEKIGDGIEQFMQVKTLVSVGLGVSAGAIMFFCGLEQWLLWGCLFFALNYITYLGSIATCVPPIVLGFVELKSPWLAVLLAVLIVLNRIFWIDYLEIRFSGKRLNISSILIFLWLAYWGWMWGVVGLILAYPMLVSLKFILEHFESTRSWAQLMAEE